MENDLKIYLNFDNIDVKFYINFDIKFDLLFAW